MKKQNEEEKVIFKPFVYAAIIMSILAVVVAVIIKNQDKVYTYTYSDGRIITDNGMGEFVGIGYGYAAIMLILLIIALVQVIRFRKQMSFVLNLVVVIIFIPVTLGIVGLSVKSIVSTDDGYDCEYYAFSNADKCIVICEKKMDDDSYIEIYQITENNEAFHMGDLDTLDGHTNKGNYKITWYDKWVDIQYSVDGTGFELSFDVQFVK